MASARAAAERRHVHALIPAASMSIRPRSEISASRSRSVRRSASTTSDSIARGRIGARERRPDRRRHRQLARAAPRGAARDSRSLRLRGAGRPSCRRDQLDGGRTEFEGFGSCARGAPDRGVRHRRAPPQRARRSCVLRPSRSFAHCPGARDRVRATVPRRLSHSGSPTHYERAGIELTVDQKLFDDRRRVEERAQSSPASGVRRKPPRQAMAVARDLLRRAERTNGGLVGRRGAADLRARQERRVRRHSSSTARSADEIDRLARAADRVGHEMGSGAIAADDVVLLDLFPIDLELGLLTPTSPARSSSATSRTRSASSTGLCRKRSSSLLPKSSPA